MAQFRGRRVRHADLGGPVQQSPPPRAHRQQPPAEAGERCHTMREEQGVAAQLKPKRLRKTRGGSDELRTMRHNMASIGKTRSANQHKRLGDGESETGRTPRPITFRDG